MTANRNLLIKVLLIIISLSCPGMVLPDTFKDGGDAYKQRDYVTAAAKFREVAAKGDHRAMYALGSMFAGGTGVKQDYKQAFKWFADAAKYGRLDAKYKIGLMYELGVGVKQNYRQAARYYQEVGQKGYAHGQFKLGQLYLHGNGVKQDLTKAYAWMIVARQNFLNTMPKTGAAGSSGNSILAVDDFQSGDIFATIHLNLINSELDGIKSRLTTAQLEEVNRLAQEYSQYR